MRLSNCGLLIAVMFKNLLGVLNKNIHIKKLFIKIRYFIKFREKIDLSIPGKTFNQKINIRKLYDNNPLYSTCSDKFMVREYVEGKIGSQYLIPLILVTEKLRIDDLLKIKPPYIVKNNHNSGGISIVHELNYNIKIVVNKANILKKLNYGLYSGENWYSGIHRKIVVEHLLLDKEGNVPPDVKVHCFKGVPNKVITIDEDRFSSNHRRNVYDENWNLLDMEFAYSRNVNTVIKERPIWFNDLIRISDILSKPFNYVRVDFYILGNKLYFGELTFASSSGFIKFDDRKWNEYMGSLWNQVII